MRDRLRLWILLRLLPTSDELFSVIVDDISDERLAAELKRRRRAHLRLVR